MITALVVPDSTINVGSELNLTTIKKIGAPKVYVPTDNIKIESGETLQVDGTLLINGSIIGGGIPSSNGVATGLQSLNDVNISSLETGQTLKWNGSRWTNQEDESGLGELDLGELTNVEISEPRSQQTLQYDGNRWANKTSEVFLNQLQDLDLSSLQDLSTLQYNQSRGEWVAVASNDLIESEINGGDAGSNYTEGFEIDGGYA